MRLPRFFWCFQAAWALLLGCPPPEPVPEPAPIIDPLSRPAEPTLAVSSFASAQTCGECHEQHYAEWRTSSHSYAMVDPVFRALVRIRQEQFDGAQDSFCLQCHTAIGTRGGAIQPGFSFDSLPAVVSEGVTCEACHKVASIERTWNAGHVLDEDGPVRASLADAEPSSAHSSQTSSVLSGSDFCGSCHDVVELSGLPLERPYSEWRDSPSAEAGQTCQDCHMPTYTGYAATGAERERTLHTHRFVGVDVPLVDGFVTPEELTLLEGQVAALLGSAATLGIDVQDAGEQLDVHVTIRNDIAGHNLPTGSTFIRQVWLELIATDQDGAVLYETGTLDAAGDLRDHWSTLDPYGDSDLISLSSSFVDERGAPAVLPWLAAEHRSNALQPLHERTWTLFVPVQPGTSEVTVRARLRFRTHAPWLLRLLGLDELVDRVGTYELDSAEVVAPRGP